MCTKKDRGIETGLKIFIINPLIVATGRHIKEDEENKKERCLQAQQNKKRFWTEDNDGR